MSGAEVLGIISAVISIVDATSKVYHAAKDEAGLPPNFKTVATKLPLITRLLDDAERYVAKEPDEGLTLALTPIVIDCNEKATQLQQLFKKVIAAEGASRSERYVKAARTIGKGGRVETLMKAILDDLQLLTTQIPQAVSRRGQENLSEAIEDVSKVKPSLPDGFEDESTYANYGSGVQNVNTGPGSLHSHQNNGPGNQYNGTNHIDSSNDFIAFGDNNLRFQTGMFNGSVNFYPTQPAPKYNQEAEEACRRDLFVTDPLEDKKALKRKKGDRVAGTCEWILGTEELIAWLGPNQNQRPASRANQVLWLHGNPGTGKSTLAIYLTDALSNQFSATGEHTLAFFFCDSAFDTRRTATSVIRGLLFQLIQQYPQLLSYVSPKYKERKAKLFESFDALWTIFISAAADRNTGRKYCIIDALDELDNESQKTLLQQLRETFHGPDDPPDIRFLVTSRPYREIRNHLAAFTHKDLASFPEVKHDIDQCIEKRVAELKYTKKIKGRITELLTEKAGGTFLWVGIACSELEDTPSKDAISRLEEMPSGLHALYEKLFTAALEKETDKRTIRLILSFVAVSQRPLNLLELSEACGVCQDEDDIETRIQFMREHVESCRLMVVIQDKKVLLLHQSVKDYLIKVGKQAGFSEPEAHADLAYRCLNYLIERFHNPKEPHGHLSDYAVSEWPNHARMAQSRFVIAGAQAEFFNITSPCRESWLAAYRARVSRFFFNQVPGQFSILHVAARWGIPSIAEHIFHSHDQHGKVERLVNLRDDSDDTALDCAVRNGHSAALRVLLSLRSMLTSNSALLAANHEENGKGLMALLLEQRGEEIEITEEVMKAAARNEGNGKEVMTLLLQQPGIKTTIAEDVLKAAAVNRRIGKEVMALLLQQPGTKSIITENVLKAAARNGGNGKEVMTLLLQQPGTKTTITEDVLKAAAGNWNNAKEVMTLLLQQPGTKSIITEDVLQTAAGNWNNGKEVMALLLQQPGIKTIITDNVLKAAGRNGGNGKEVMALLLQQPGIKTTITDDVLKAAAANEGNGKEVMALLLQQPGIKTTITDDVLKAAAANEGNGKEVMALLLQQPGIKTTITEDVLKAAATNRSNGKEVMVLLLQLPGIKTSITEDVLKTAARNRRIGKEVMALLLQQPGIKTIITDDVLKAAATNRSNGKEVMALLLQQPGIKTTITDDVLEAAAANEGDGKEVMALLLQQPGIKTTITDDVLKAAAENEGNGKEVMALLLQQPGIKTTITENVVEAAAGNWNNGKEVMTLLLQQPGTKTTITEDVLKAAGRNGGNGKEVMALLLQQPGIKTTITEDVLKAAARYGGNGKEVMTLLLQQPGTKTTITEDVLKAAAENEASGKKVMALLLQQPGIETIITEDVLKAAAGNEGDGKEVMTLLLQQLGTKSTITEDVLKAAAGNEGDGKEVMALLLQQPGIKSTITEDVLKAAARNGGDGKEVMTLLLQQRGIKTTITEDMLKAAARNQLNGKEVMALLLQQPGTKATITEDVLKAAAVNRRIGKEVMALLLQQPGIKSIITDDVLKAAAGNEGNGKEVMALLLQQPGIKTTITEDVLKTAARNRRIGKEVMALLLQQPGIKTTITEDVLKAAAGNEENGQQIIQLLFEQCREDIAASTTESVLLTAATCGQEGVLNLITRQGGPVSASDNHYRIAKFYNAAKTGNARCIEQLIEDGAKPDLKNPRGVTPLWIAARGGNDAVARILAQRSDVDVNSLSTDMRSPIFWPACLGNEKVVDILLEAKADAGIVDVNGNTAVMMARRNGHERIVRALENSQVALHPSSAS